MRECNFTYNDAYHLPVWKRMWFLNKLKAHIEEKNNAMQNQQNSSQRNKNIFKKSF